jgi:ATP-dependent Clp protease ATP-binding subunit ClpC
MKAQRFPILMIESHAGLHTAMLAGMPEYSATDRTPSGCVQQLRGLLQWLARNRPWELNPMNEWQGRLEVIHLEVTPQVVEGRQRFPDPAPMRVTVPCIMGSMPGAGHFCVAPTLDLWLNVNSESELRPTTEMYLREHLRGKEAPELARHIAAASYRLDEFSMRLKADFSRVRQGGSVLEQVADALGERNIRRQFPRAWEREADIGNLIARVQRDRESVLLVGNAGVGKSSVLVSAAREIERTLKPEHPQAEFTRRRFWMTSASRLIAGTPYLGMWEQRLEDVIAALADMDGVLCIENLLDLVRVGGAEPGSSVGAFLVPYLKHNQVRIVAEATPTELEACRRLLPSLADALSIQHVPDFSAAQSMMVLQRLADQASRNERVEFSNDAVQAVHRLFMRFRPYDAMPGQAARFMQAVALSAASDHGAAGATRVTEPDVVERFERETGLPLVFLRDDALLDKGDVLGRLKSRVMGQDKACDAVAAVVLTFKAGLNDPRRPVGSLLFTGPTGVGKTELARALAQEMFGAGASDGGDSRLVRLDMSEYAGVGAADRILADARGEPSDFVRRLRAQPFCVVLMDEIEKAAPDVYDLMLAMLDEGRLTDRLGRVTSLQSAVIVMTSNLGAERTAPLGFGEDRPPDYDSAVSRFFRPEFYNRLDAVVTFNSLAEGTIREIAAKELREFASREGLTAQGVKLVWSDDVPALIAKAGYDRRFGARPLQRALEQLVTTPLARLLAEDPTLRDIEVRLEAKDGRVELGVVG